MGVMLDTSVLVGAERRTVRLDALLASLADQAVTMAAVTAAELLHGCHRAAEAGVRARRFAFVDGLLHLIPVQPFGLPEARRHAELWAALAHEGTMIGAHDLLIAATALAHGHALATLDQREFRQVPGLRLVALEAYLS